MSAGRATPDFFCVASLLEKRLLVFLFYYLDFELKYIENVLSAEAVLCLTIYPYNGIFFV